MKKRVLFVCLGNICRSPSAEAVFKHIVEDKHLKDNFEIDSAGTSGYHAGEPADARMQQHASMRGIRLTSISRQFNAPYDFDHFDIIVAMDEDNLDKLKQLARHKKDLAKLCLMTDFASSNQYTEVLDPYYGGAQGFETVLDILEDAGQGLLKHLITTPA